MSLLEPFKCSVTVPNVNKSFVAYLTSRVVIVTLVPPAGLGRQSRDGRANGIGAKASCQGPRHR